MRCYSVTIILLFVTVTILNGAPAIEDDDEVEESPLENGDWDVGEARVERDHGHHHHYHPGHHGDKHGGKTSKPWYNAGNNDKVRAASRLDKGPLGCPGEKTAEGVRFLLFTIKNPQKGEVIGRGEYLESSAFWDKTQKVILIIHGFSESGGDSAALRKHSESTMVIKNAYLEMYRPENIITVDWAALSMETNYYNSARNVRVVANEMAKFLVALVKRKLIPSYDDIHIVGFSLGGQMAGIAGFNIQQMTHGEKLGRITGVDPAGPGFEEFVPEAYRLDKDDAKFVQAIHCGAGDFLTDHSFGTPLLSGFEVCSHMKCPSLFAAAISHQFIGCPSPGGWLQYIKGDGTCKDGVIMGEYCPTNATGIYYVHADTNAMDVVRRGGVPNNG